MSTSTAARAALLTGLLLTAACGQARKTPEAQGPARCARCHGGLADSSGAPPYDLQRRTDTHLTSVGAHARHLASGVACSSCHVVPVQLDSPGHMDGAVTLTFGGMAVANGATPTWAHGSATCSNVYCHGTRFTGASAGADPTPLWTGTLAGGACGACHAAQPRGHAAFALADCAQCHPGTVDATGQLVPGGQHLDGRLQVSVSSCTGCHGGTDNSSGAPPRDVAGHTATTEVTVGAHTAHVAAGFACTACHPVPDPASAGSHISGGTAEIAWGPVATAGGATPTWSRAGATCSGVYCHGAFQGGNQRTATWTQVGTGQAACGACHGQAGAEFPGAPVTNHPALATGSGATVCNACHPGTVDAAGRPAGGQHVDGTLQLDPYSKHPAGFAGTPHQAAAAAGVATCMRCHAARPPAQVTTRVCSTCHDPLAGGKDWTTTCNTCHGSALSDAPPPWNTPNHDPAAGGAHQAHVLAASNLSVPLGCEYCHLKPATVLSEGHLDGAIHVTGYTGVDPTWKLAAPNPGWSAATSSCATAYCHGAFPGGNAANVPVWTAVGQGQAACGTCHGLPPGAPHPEIPAGGLAGCNACHPGTVDASGALVLPSAGGKHLDGTVQVEGGHQPSWMDPASPGFHAASVSTGLSNCRVCHGANLDGGFAKVACASCHGASWRTSCTMCHGGDQDASGAPPKATWGQGADPIRVGAHQRHVRGGAIQPGGFDCAVCHVKPTDALSPGHVDGPTATVTFSGVAMPATAWDRGTPSCTVYCHGTSLQGGTRLVPSWTSTGGPLDCTSCHGAPPPAPHPAITGGIGTCNACHPATVDATGAILPRASGGKHLDGQVQFASGHGPAWMNSSDPGFHGGAIYGSLSSCQFCHGANLDGVGGTTTVGCASCHGPGWRTDCTMCHGATDNSTGAPPRATFIHRSLAQAVGAHSAHVGRSDAATTTGAGLALKLGCDSCHTTPADALSAAHIDGGVAVSGYTGGNLARRAAMTDPGWNPTTVTCTTSYCHGATLQGGALTTPSWTAATGTQATCGSCHALPPATGPLWTPTTPAHRISNHVQAHCGRCHDGYTETSVNPALHVNASRDVSISHTAPNPDPPPPAAPTMEACSALVTVRSSVAGWDCAGCHNYRDYAYNRCCADPGAPNPDWCATYW